MKVEPVFLRTEHNYDRDAASDATADVNLEPSLTKQSFAEEADINVIVRRFGLTGELPSDVKVPMNGDFTNVVDFRGAMDLLIQAREAFMTMPADVRSRFGNDPAAFVDFVSDEKNRDEAKKMGLLVPATAPLAPVEVRVVEPVKPA